MKVKLAAGLLALASTIAGVAQASPNVRGSYVTGQQGQATRQLPVARVDAAKPAKQRFVKRSGQRAEAGHMTLRERERPATAGPWTPKIARPACPPVR